MKPLEPEQWRILDYLYHHKLHTVRPALTHVCKSQKVTDTDLDTLAEAGYIAGQIDGTDLDPQIGLHKLSPHIQRHIRLRLTQAGLGIVLDDPGNQIRYTLGQYDKPIRLAKLFDGNTITPDDVSGQHTRRLISITLADVGEIDSPTADELARRSVKTHMYVDYVFGDIAKVSLTAKGREYLPL